ncbi:MAG TPA: Coenzyme F420 hydrogenase/dehydrogenase, beta subunit C-terminal domain [Thermodesulfobacteriota bacterium]|nr:Coenzyme F420 hydrogenase/dehydrogenase, beta subunit C-terminal domain [Thermodesulfobacteriota bacterium]
MIQKDLCTSCGACLSLCPYLQSWQGRLVKLDNCDLAEGRCFANCPRTQVNLETIYQEVFGQRYLNIELGLFKQVKMARASSPDIRKKSQTSGVVSALMEFALREEFIHGAVLTHRTGDHLPRGRVIRRPDEILSCAGSSYVAGPTLQALNQGPWEDTERIGVVGTPCQVLAMRKMGVSPLKKTSLMDRVTLIVGLFCTWALTYEPFMKYLRNRVNGARIRKLDIIPPPERLLKVITDDDRTWNVPIDEIRPFIRTTCGICLDMTSELSDLSVGTVEGIQGWNTVITRSDLGEEILSRAEAAGIVESQPLPKEYLKHLKEASLLKKQRALLTLKERGELEDGYIILSHELIGRILSEAKEAGS